jgi:serine O-acetyltransferase
MEEKRFLKTIYNNYQSRSNDVPSKILAHKFLDEIVGIIFPNYTDKYSSVQDIEIKWEQSKIKLKELLLPISPLIDKEPEFYVSFFYGGIEGVYHKLLKDAKAILQFDPAAYSIEEIILAYPGFYATMVYRLSNILFKLGVPIIPRILSEYAHSKTGVDIHPGATIGENFFIDHGTGIVIGETTIIGNDVKIYQGVTLGALIVNKESAKTKRHPTIEDNVIIYSGTTILGGETVIGHNSVIGGNVWLTESVKSNSLVFHTSQTKIKTKNNENR